MPIKVDGTNGVLQAYDFQIPTTGFSYTFSAAVQTLIMNPAGTLASGTITMPASPVDGMVITVQSTQQITALTIQGNTGQSFVGGAVTLRANQPLSFMYRLSNTTWYPFSGASNSDIISGTSVASTSGTSIDFTGIPSWVKRITLLINAVSTNGTANLMAQIGSGSVVTSGYVCQLSAATSAWAGSISTCTNGFQFYNTGAVSDAAYGHVVLTNVSGNIWIYSSNVISTNPRASQGTGGLTLSGALDRIRITTSNGTDAFDAGSINILYE